MANCDGALHSYKASGLDIKQCLNCFVRESHLPFPDDMRQCLRHYELLNFDNNAMPNAPCRNWLVSCSCPKWTLTYMVLGETYIQSLSVAAGY
jgi:hypothetical protein